MGRGPRLSLDKVNFRRGSRSKPEGIERPAAPVAYREGRAPVRYIHVPSEILYRLNPSVWCQCLGDI